MASVDESDESGAIEKYYRQILLSHKDVATEKLLEHIWLDEQSKLPSHLSSDERNMVLTKQVQARILQLSSTLVLKLMPLAKNVITQKESLQIDAELAKIEVQPMEVKEKSLLYTKMFGNFVDDDVSVSFAANNKRLLGNVTMRDYFCFMIWTFATCQRCKSDDCLMLYVSGERRLSVRYCYSQTELTRCCFL